MRKFAVSDIHGCAKTFRTLIEDKIQLQKEDILYLLGDYVDRGPDSKGVIDFILELRSKGFQVYCLLGNHEDMMLKAMNSKKNLDLWVYNGGGATLKSFQVEGIKQLPQKYIAFLNELKYYLEVDAYILVHAGLNFRQDNPLSIGKEMLWIRFWTEQINKKWLDNRIILHGHTPIREQEIREDAERIKELQFLNIDCGCYYSHKQGKGKLCAFELTKQELFFQENVEHG